VDNLYKRGEGGKKLTPLTICSPGPLGKKKKKKKKRNGGLSIAHTAAKIRKTKKVKGTVVFLY